MASAEILKEFLVSLGYKIDRASQREFVSGVGRATAEVAALGVAIGGAATALVAYTNRAAESGEKLYWLSQRTQTSAKGIEAIGYAASQTGSSVEAAQSSIEAFGAFLRSSPGARAAVERYTGSFTDLEDALLKLGERFKGEPIWRAEAIGQAFGLDSKFVQSLINGDFAKRVQEQRARAANVGLDKDQFAREATSFKQAWREFWAELDATSDRAAGELFAPLSRAFRDIAAELRDTNGQVGVDFANAIKDIARNTARELSVIGDTWRAFRALIHGDDQTAKEYAARALETTGNPQAEGLLTKEAWSSWGGMKTALRQAFGLEAAPEKPVTDAAGAVAFFMARGWTREQAAGIVGNLLGESGLDPAAVGDSGNARGVAQWHASRQADFARQFGKPLSAASLNEQLSFVDWELRNTESAAGDRLRRARTVNEAVGAGLAYERPADPLGDYGRRLGLAQSAINQTVNITVNGSGPDVIAQFRQELDRANEQMLRNMSLNLSPAWR